MAHSHQLNALKLGLAGGILWGGALFIFTWIAMLSGYGMFWLSQWLDLFPGYNLTVLGSILALLYGFIDGFIMLTLLAWLYNLLNRPPKK